MWREREREHQQWEQFEILVFTNKWREGKREGERELLVRIYLYKGSLTVRAIR